MVSTYPLAEWGGEFAMAGLVAVVEDGDRRAMWSGSTDVTVAQFFQPSSAEVTSWARSRLPRGLSQRSRIRLVLLRPCAIDLNVGVPPGVEYNNYRLGP